MPSFGDLSIRRKLTVVVMVTTCTAIWNRGAIIELLERELNRSRRDGSSVGVLLADIDHFKMINDTKGHLIGDEVLRAVTGRLKSEVRSYDSVGRYGGEEFLILLPGCDTPKLAAKAERLVNILDRSPIGTSVGAVRVTISMGGIASGECPRADSNSLLRAADTALYRAKVGGRNRSEMAHLPDLELLMQTLDTELAPDTVTSPTSSK